MTPDLMLACTRETDTNEYLLRSRLTFIGRLADVNMLHQKPFCNPVFAGKAAPNIWGVMVDIKIPLHAFPSSRVEHLHGRP